MNWTTIQSDHEAVAREVYGPLRPAIEAFTRELADTLRRGGKLLTCGNGGSASDALHIAGEFTNRFLLERKPYAAIALTADVASMTAIGNDYTFDLVYAKQVQAIGRPGDVLLAISTSGNAANVCRALETARAMGVRTALLTGGNGGKAAALADVILSVSCTRSTPRIQEGHVMIYHLFCQLIEELMEA